MTTKMSALGAYLTGKANLPYDYVVERGADVLLLRRGDGSVVATFGAANTTPSEVARIAEQDFHSNRRTL